MQPRCSRGAAEVQPRSPAPRCRCTLTRRTRGAAPEGRGTRSSRAPSSSPRPPVGRPSTHTNAPPPGAEMPRQASGSQTRNTGSQGGRANLIARAQTRLGGRSSPATRLDPRTDSLIGLYPSLGRAPSYIDHSPDSPPNLYPLPPLPALAPSSLGICSQSRRVLTVSSAVQESGNLRRLIGPVDCPSVSCVLRVQQSGPGATAGDSVPALVSAPKPIVCSVCVRVARPPC